MLSRQGTKAPPIPKEDRGSFFHLPKTTLILVPSHLIDQWSEEINKFVK